MPNGHPLIEMRDIARIDLADAAVGRALRSALRQQSVERFLASVQPVVRPKQVALQVGFQVGFQVASTKHHGASRFLNSISDPSRSICL